MPSSEPCCKKQPLLPPSCSAGVLQVEALAQLGGIAMIDPADKGQQNNFFFGGVDGVRWKKPVVPGDVLVSWGRGPHGSEMGACLNFGVRTATLGVLPSWRAWSPGVSHQNPIGIMTRDGSITCHVQPPLAASRDNPSQPSR